MEDTKKTAGAEAPATPETGKTASEATTQTASVNVEVEKLQKKVATLEKENAALKAELKDAAKVVDDLKEQLADKANAGVLTVKVGSKKYVVVGGCVLEGKPYTKEDIAADAKIAEKLIKKGSKLVIEK